MKYIIAIFTAFAVAMALFLGGGQAIAQGKADTSTCEKSFKDADSGNKGYLTMNDFEAMHHGVGKHKGYPAGTTMDRTHFENTDKNKDSRVTLQEYCAQ